MEAVGKGGRRMKDEGIVELFFERDEAAIAEFEKSYKPLCLKLANDITGSPESAEECLNDMYLRLWNSIPPEKPVSLKNYACRIIRNLALSLVEKQNAAKRNAPLAELDECIAADMADMESREIGALIDSFLETLPPLQAKLFVRRYFYSEPVGEIAARLGIGENKASKLLAKMRRSLKKHLTEGGAML